jgi:hypothetical protein
MVLNKKAFKVASLYVGIGSVVLGALFPSDLLYNEYSYLLLIITFPTNFVSLMIRYSCNDCTVYVIITQCIFFIIWYSILKSRLK